MEIRKIYLSEIGKILNLKLHGKPGYINGMSFRFNNVHNYKKLITFCISEEFFYKAENSLNVVAIITTQNVFDKIKDKNKSYFLTEEPETTFYFLHNFLLSNTSFYNEFEFEKKIGEGSQIHKSVVIDDGVIIGKDVVLNPNVVIRKGCIIGDYVTIKPNTVIGEDGFMVRKFNDKNRIIKHTGGVKIGNNVEIGSNCGIDKALFEGFTEVGDNTKTDNLVHIAHNVIIGENCIIPAGVTISGFTTIGNNSWIGPGAIISDSLKIGNNVKISLGSVVVKNLIDNGYVSGNFAISHDRFLDNFIKSIS